MLSFQSFEKLSKCELYQIYVDLFKKVEEKDDLIKNFVLQCSTYIKERRQDGDQAIYKKDQEVPHNLNNEYKVRTFPTFNIPENTENLLLGSSLVKNLVNDHSIPQDICIHVYRGSTTKEKIAVLEKYPEKELKTVVLQDGTNSILKQKHRDVNDLFNEYIELVEVESHKFKPKSLVLMEIPPIKSSNHNSVANERISAFNNKLEIYANSANNMNLKLLPIHQMMLKLPHYNYLFYDDLLFNYQQGVPFLKNAVLGHFLLTSNNIIANAQYNRSFNQSFNRNKFHSFQRKPFNQTYYYTRGNTHF